MSEMVECRERISVILSGSEETAPLHFGEHENRSAGCRLGSEGGEVLIPDTVGLACGEAERTRKVRIFQKRSGHTSS